MPVRLSIIWSPDARADLRSIDRKTALDILHCIDRYLETRSGDVKSLRPPMDGYRLRCGDYRILFRQDAEYSISITGVKQSTGRLQITQSRGVHPAVNFSVSTDIFAVRSSLSQLNGLPSMARFTVFSSTSENTCLYVNR